MHIGKATLWYWFSIYLNLVKMFLMYRQLELVKTNKTNILVAVLVQNFIY